MQVSDALNSIQNLVSSLNTLKSTLNSTINSTQNNKLKKNIDGSVSGISAIKKAFNFGAIYIGLKKGWNIVKNISTEYINMTETNNLFEVSMGKVVDQYGNLDEEASQYYTKAMAFQDEMNEKLLTNKAELKEYQAMYYSMLKSQGINKDASYLMSESLTKAGYDIASLYNLTVEDAMDKLKSGLAGQVEPLRKIGIDISESSLNKVIKEAGITDRSVQQLSYAEKEVARYIAILQQGQQAQGDFARTMDNSANQIRIFKNQIAELKQVAGAFIMNTFGNILVYVNAVIMVLKEILKSFASLFGYDLETGGADLSSTTGVDGLNDGLGTAIDNAKKLKKQLMGFDEINNIDPNSKASSGSGGGGISGIDEKLLNSLKEWDNQMSSISGKAQEIRDRMLEWLGFERDDNGTWKLKEGYTNFEKILDTVKAIGAAILTWKVSKAITDLFANLGILSKMQSFKLAFGLTLALTGIYALYKGTEHLLDGDIDLFTILETVLGTAGGAFGIVSLLNATKKGKMLSLPNKIMIGTGVMLTLQGLQVTMDGIKNDDWKKKIAGALEAGTATGVTFGFVKGSWQLGLKAGLLVTIGTISFAGGLSIGDWLKQNYGNNIDWYIERFNLNLNEDNIVEQCIKIAGIILGTIGDSIIGGIQNAGGWIDQNVITPIKNYMKEHPLIAKIGESIWETIKDSVINAMTGGQGAVIVKIIEISTEWIKNIRKTWNEKIVPWWNEDVAPWFTKEKWQKLGENIKQGISSKWNEFQDWWSNTAIVQWWNNKVAPWFTKEKWQQLADNGKTGLANKFTEWKNNFKPIEEWWNSKVAPWFTKEKWQELANNGKIGIENKFNEWKNSFNPVSNWWNDKIKPWFTWEKWRNLATDAVQGMQSVFSNFNFKIKLPHFSWTSTPASGWMANVLSALNLPTSIPKLNVSWYANGGMPEMGELFVAREAGPEMVGKIGNKATVANNDQIVTAIKQGVYEAVTSAMANGSNEVHLNIRTEEGVIVEKASRGFTEYVMQKGELPFPVPV